MSHLTKVAALCAALTVASAGPVTIMLDGKPAVPGDYPFEDVNGYRNIVVQNGILEFEFGAVQNTLPSAYWTMSCVRVTHLPTNTQLGNNVSGSQNDGEQHMSFYVDWGGGPNRWALIAETIRIVRANSTLAEFAFIDNSNTPLNNEHHMIMTSETSGLYGYNIMTATANYGLNEVRMNTRWNRCLFNQAYNHERGYDQKQPTYAYLFTQTKVSDETWRVDGINNPNLPCPEDNAGGLPAGTVYTKYDWSLYHFENPIYGHMGIDSKTGNVFGAWWTPLSGISDTTSTGGFGVGPNRQDLAIHQDSIILGYFIPNHYGLPAYNVRTGYKRLNGPWLTHVTFKEPGSSFDDLIANATAIARNEIAKSRHHLAIIDNQPMYPTTTRMNVTGKIAVADKRPGSGLYILLCTVVTTDIYTVKEPTYFVKSEGADGSFALPGIPPATYSLYIFGASGSITDQRRIDGIVVNGTVPTLDLGTITLTPFDNGFTHLWALGQSDRMSTEFNLGTVPRSYTLWNEVPATASFTIGESHEPVDWYYTQTKPGTWTVTFNLPQAYSGTAHLTVAASMRGNNNPRVAVNGATSGISGTTPTGSDGAMARQAQRSGIPQSSTLTFDASMLTAGENTIAFTRGGTAGSNGMGYDVVVLSIDESAKNTRASPAALRVIVEVSPPAKSTTAVPVRILAQNTGETHAMDARLISLVWVSSTGQRSTASVLKGRDPSLFPSSLGNVLAGAGLMRGGAQGAEELLLAGPPQTAAEGVSYALEATLSADGGRTRAVGQSSQQTEQSGSPRSSETVDGWR